MGHLVKPLEIIVDRLLVRHFVQLHETNDMNQE